MIPTFVRKRLSPPMLVSLAALFAALGGAGYAATGGNFVLGQANTADQPTRLTSSSTTGPALRLTSSAAQPAASFSVPGDTTAPFTVNSKGKVAKLNADMLDGVDSSGFLRSVAPVTLNGSTSSTVLQGVNNGAGGGVYGKGGTYPASGVYGEGTQDGYGIAGRAYGSHGAIYGQNLGTGPALELWTQPGVAPMTVNSASRVDNLNSTYLDGIDSYGFIQGRGNTYIQAFAVPFHGDVPLLEIPGLVKVTFQCGDATHQSTLYIDSESPLTTNYFRRVAYAGSASDVKYVQTSGPNRIDVTNVGSPDMTDFTIQEGTDSGRQRVARVEIASATRSADCHAQGQALLTQFGE